MSETGRRYVIRRCRECHGQVGESTVAHFNDCPNTYVAFVPEEVLVPWPGQSRPNPMPMSPPPGFAIPEKVPRSRRR